MREQLFWHTRHAAGVRMCGNIVCLLRFFKLSRLSGQMTFSQKGVYGISSSQFRRLRARKMQHIFVQLQLKRIHYRENLTRVNSTGSLMVFNSRYPRSEKYSRTMLAVNSLAYSLPYVKMKCVFQLLAETFNGAGFSPCFRLAISLKGSSSDWWTHWKITQHILYVLE